MNKLLFPFYDYWPFYVVFSIVILIIVILDLGIFHKEDHVISFKESAIWTSVWMGMAGLFNIAFYYYLKWKFVNDISYASIPGFDPYLQAKTSALEFLTGFIVEKSLAIDNIFIFAVVFSYFAIPPKYQHRVLFWGILGALLFRAIFIGLGSVLMQYEWVIIIFGAFLILTGIKMFFASSEKQDLSKNIIIGTLKRFVRIHPQIEGKSFFIKKSGLIYATPLFLALVFLEFTDIIFAIDSVPAIFAITKEPLIVFTSNIFAILGLRSLYFMLAGVMDRFIYIKYGLGAVLIFVGSKMVYLNHAFGGKFPILWSLAIIVLCVGSSILASIIISGKKSSTNLS